MLGKTFFFAALLVSVAVLANSQMGKFTGAEDHSISLQDAAQLTHRFQRANPDGVKAHFFGRQAIEKILAQDGVVGIRIYNGADETGRQHLVLVGTNGDGEDQFKGELAQFGGICPPFCDEESALLSASQVQVAAK